MELTENLPEVLAGLACDDETEGPGPPSVTEVPPLSSGSVVVTVADGARRIDATTPAICCTASGDKPPVGDKVVDADTEVGGMNNSDTIGAEVTGG